MSHPIRVILKRGRSKPFWLGHPWVFSGAIHKVQGKVGETGGPCLVEDERGNVVGAGFYNPHAKISVRLLQHRRTTDVPFEPRPVLDVVRERLDVAVARRHALGLPAEGTDAYRVVNAEGDELGGLIVERMGPAAVMHVGSRQMYELREAIAREVAERLDVDRVVLRISEDASRLEAIPVESEVLPGAGGQVASGPLEIRENGVRYRVDAEGGHKTGFYLDQRENRHRFGALCGGQRVADLYSYSGGFGLNAALAGAEAVVSVDSSGPAIELARANAELNGVADRLAPVQADVMNFLKESVARGDRYDRVVCDPPKFARGRSHVAEALKKYARVNRLAMDVLAPGGVMLSCSCSQHVSDQDFLRMLTDAAHRLRRSVAVHAVWSQAQDHPFAVVAPEGKYLTAVLLTLG